MLPFVGEAQVLQHARQEVIVADEEVARRAGGDTAGVAPGYKGSVSWRRLRFYSEGEYVFDMRESSDSFFFNWSELTVSPVDWLRAGLATQRTRVYRTDRDIQRGIVVGVTYRNLDVAGYVLNPDEDRPTVIAAVSVGW